MEEKKDDDDDMPEELKDKKPPEYCENGDEIIIEIFKRRERKNERLPKEN